jgi:hypothetical protein
MTTAPEAAAPFRCAAASLARGESIAGTASTVHAFVAVEDPGPWGERALVDSRLPEEAKRFLRSLESARTKVLLVRRPGRAARQATGVRVLVAHAVEPWLETTVLDRVEDVTSLDLTGLDEGRSPGLERVDAPAYLVCTHGRHDACCAERGRPYATALAEVAPDETWEVSHLGGDRFAANALVLPHGLYYGRLPVERAASFAEEHAAGRLDLEHLRGRSRFGFAVQAAEIHLRRELDDRRVAAYLLRAVSRDEHRTAVTFEVDGTRWRVEVVRSANPPETLTCKARAASASPHHELAAITRL